MSKHFDRAQVLFEQRRYELAEKELRAEIAENPESADAHALLAACIINRKRQQPKNVFESLQGKQSQLEELNLLEFALSKDANNAWYQYLLGIYWYNRGHFERAKKQIEVAISLAPHSAHYHYMLACILFDLGNMQFNGMSAATRGVADFFRSYLIRHYLKPVLAPLMRSLALDPDDLPALNLLTNLYVTTGRYQEALATSETALALDPNNAHAQDLHGQILSGCGKYTEAIEYFQSSLRIDPNFTQARSNLLEAMRSQFWIYPWINFNHWRGKLLLVLLFPVMFIIPTLIRYFLTGSINIRTPWEDLGFIPVFFLLITSFTSQWSFNYFLITSKQTKFLLTDRDAIYAHFTLAGTIVALLWIYSCLLPLDSLWRSPAMNLAGTIGGIWIPPFTFSAVEKVKLPILKTAYPIGVALLGLLHLVLYFQGREIVPMTQILLALVMFTPVIAVCNCQIYE